MPQNESHAIAQLLLPAVVLFFLLWSIVGAAVGAGLIFFSAQMFRLFGVMNRYVSTRHLLKPLAQARELRQGVRRHNRVVGICIVAGCAYAIFGLVAWFDHAAVVGALNLRYPAAFVGWILDSVRWFLIVFCALGGAIGAVLAAAPHVLERYEARANRWFSVRKLTYGADDMNLSLERLVAAFPRASGAIIMVATLYVAANLAHLWLRLG